MLQKADISNNMFVIVFSLNILIFKAVFLLTQFLYSINRSDIQIEELVTVDNEIFKFISKKYKFGKL